MQTNIKQNSKIVFYFFGYKYKSPPIIDVELQTFMIKDPLDHTYFGYYTDCINYDLIIF